MAGETSLTVVGTITADPELRFLPTGAAVCNFTIASNARTFDKQANEWRDEPPLFLRCSVWRELAEHCAESLSKGTRVIAQGNLKMRQFEKDGQKRTSTELDVQAVGPELRWATAKVVKAARGGEGQQQRGGYGSTPSSGATVDDPWTQSSGAPDGEPPF